MSRFAIVGVALMILCVPAVLAQVVGSQQLPPPSYEESFDGLSNWNLGPHAADFSLQVMRADGRSNSSALLYTCPSPAPTGPVVITTMINVQMGSPANITFIEAHFAADLAPATTDTVEVRVGPYGPSMRFNRADYGPSLPSGYIMRGNDEFGSAFGGGLSPMTITISNTQGNSFPLHPGDRVWIDHVKFRPTGVPVSQQQQYWSDYPFRCTAGVGGWDGKPDPLYSQQPGQFTRFAAGMCRVNYPVAIFVSWPDAATSVVPGFAGLMHYSPSTITMLITTPTHPPSVQFVWVIADVPSVPSSLAGVTIAVQAAQLSTFLPNDSLFGIPRMVTFNDGNL